MLQYRHFVWVALLLVGIAVAGTGLMSIQDSPPGRASAASGGVTEIKLSLPSHDRCDDPDQPTICTLATGTTFTISVDLLNPPAVGYILAQAWLDYDNQGLVHNPIPAPIWPDLEPASFLTIDDVGNHGAQAGGLSGFIAPVPASFYAGSLYTFDFTCTASPSTSTLKLIPSPDPPAGTSGSLLTNADPGGSKTVPKVGELTVECLGLPEPGDTDGDGCSDQQEFGNDETKGGRRNYLNPWDYFDTNGDQFIDLPNDILGVIQHFAPQGQPPYDVQFDCGHRDGETLWSMTAPDGVIDLPIDILGVIYQFGHSCQ